MGYLSYPASAIVTVLAKGAHFGENGEEFWEAEVRKEIFLYPESLSTAIFVAYS